MFISSNVCSSTDPRAKFLHTTAFQ